MKIELKEHEINEFTKQIKEVCGIDLAPKKDILLIKLPSFLAELDLPSLSSLNTKLVFNKQIKQKVYDFVTICETYFYRELDQLKDVISYIKSLERPACILCAPCASGEEVYSLAMLAANSFVRGLRIQGIDINQEAINKCKIASYSLRSVGRLSERDKDKFFDFNNGSYLLKKGELGSCKFSLCNVFDNDLFKLGSFDVILSRNMMIYFDDEFKKKLMERFSKILNPHGRLYVGNTDLVPTVGCFNKIFGQRSSSFYEKA